MLRNSVAIGISELRNMTNFKTQISNECQMAESQIVNGAEIAL